jgi:hypothetical protein
VGIGGLFPISKIELEYAIFLKVANPFDPQWKRYFLERAFVVKVRLINLIDLRGTASDEIDGERFGGLVLARGRGWIVLPSGPREDDLQRVVCRSHYRVW